MTLAAPVGPASKTLDPLPMRIEVPRRAPGSHLDPLASPEPLTEGILPARSHLLAQRGQLVSRSIAHVPELVAPEPAKQIP